MRELMSGAKVQLLQFVASNENRTTPRNSAREFGNRMPNRVYLVLVSLDFVRLGHREFRFLDLSAALINDRQLRE